MNDAVEHDLDELYDHAPCGNLSTLLDGTIAKVNSTLLGWLGYSRDELVGRRRFSDLLTVGGKIYHETHFAPLLQMQGEVNGIALDLKAADGTRLPVLVTSTVKTGSDGQPLLIRTTVFDARARRAYEQELLRARQVAERERERLRLLVAGLQRSLLPASLPTPPGMQAAAHYHMASPDEVGGDFYDLFPLDGGRWGFFLGDVRGKGIDAAAVTAAARYTLRAAAVYDATPTAVLANLNAVLFQDYGSEGHRHCTVTFGVLTPTPSGYAVTIAGGGHPAPLLARADGTVDYQPTLGGTLIGILATPRLVARSFALAAGDTLILYSDGLTEARTDPAGGRYGSEALRSFVANVAPTTADAVVAELTGLVGRLAGDLDDDVAMMALGVTAPGS
ncbi:sigma-B regulation protein RsbU (phosphoserine phosphatase) [Asanoa ferruginea]|uniref:Sigma-B regulation protein RsbU (Phosphoserine phosphatase) n=1 Tax=Asanoa ferruginea TaxID=53367 RepID=A0A3D9ZLZ0_9ACTN|nr:SpoIIE family protein phosphatase [Asanoa ferruginea]REF94660.1 sigma-B regulation protein RsbU (phosphoserine phosphatase) [Asanoa ferruginea]GIF53026.1 histidine kinase [Asanoa ferruginea]